MTRITNRSLFPPPPPPYCGPTRATLEPSSPLRAGKIITYFNFNLYNLRDLRYQLDNAKSPKFETKILAWLLKCHPTEPYKINATVSCQNTTQSRLIIHYFIP